MFEHKWSTSLTLRVAADPPQTPPYSFTIVTVVTQVINVPGNEKCCQGQYGNTVTSCVAKGWSALVSAIEPFAN